MAISRYTFAKGLTVNGNPAIQTNLFSSRVFNAVQSGQINFTTHILEEGERLDTIAALKYGDSSYWWVIASASGIGWPLQVPPGTYLYIPTNIGDVLSLMR